MALYGSRVTCLASQALLDRIVFSRGSAMDFDPGVCSPGGSSAARLLDNTAADRSPAWSPDGTRIAFGRQRTGEDSEIVVMNAGAASAVRVVEDGVSVLR